MTQKTMTTAVISKDLAERVRASEWPRGAMLPSRSELSRSYGVSPSTISNAICALKNQKLVETVPGKGVFVAVYPGANRNSRHSSEAGTVIALAGSYLPCEADLKNIDLMGMSRLPIINELYEVSFSLGHTLVLMPDSGRRINFNLLKSMNVDGLILLGGYPQEELIEACRVGLPFVLGNDPRQPLPLTYRDYNTEGSIKDMVERFVRAGHTRIGYIGFETTVPGYINHLRTCFVENLLEKNICYNFHHYWCVASLDATVSYSREECGRIGEDLVERLFGQDESPTAIYCAQQCLLPGVRSGISKLGLRVPEDVSLMVCYDFLDEGECSGLVHPRRELASALLDALQGVIDDPAGISQAKLALPFIDRGTVRDLI